VVSRRGDDLPDGKGAALTAVPVEAYRGDVVVVLDADARIGPGFLSTLDHYVEAGAVAITARRRILDARSSWLAGAQADEQTVDGELQRGRWALDGLSEFRGNGIVVARDLLEEVGGWRAEALTEDLDLSSRVAAARGHGVAWALDAEVWEEPVRDWRSLWRQRTRWAEGALRRMLEHWPAVVGSPLVSWRAKGDFLAYGGQLLFPPLFLGALAGAVAGGRRGLAAVLLALYGAAAAALAWDALRWETAADGHGLGVGERAVRAARAAVFGAVWLAAVPAALWRLATRRGAVVYDKMSRHGVRS
jgi:1,2-diacylglycerol 3-beta-glucosyltransferase